MPAAAPSFYFIDIQSDQAAAFDDKQFTGFWFQWQRRIKLTSQWRRAGAIRMHADFL